MAGRILTPYTLADLPPALTGAVVAIGNFDGVHHGHVQVLEAARREADRRGVPAVVLTFEPHPRTLLRPDEPVFRLTPLAAKARLLAALGMDGLVAAVFDRAFSELAPDDFVREVLVERLKVAAIVVGHDFRFGRGRQGTFADLIAGGARHGFTAIEVAGAFDETGAAYGSSVIRRALAAGEIATANHLLGYRWFVSGEVVAGDRRGRLLGFPTANMRLGDDSRLRHGVYAVRFERPDGTRHDGVASFGRRPTFDNGAPLLETFLFDFSGSLYGEVATVTFFAWIRPEERFDGITPLVEAIDRDCAAARAVLAGAGPGTALDEALSRLG
jgi:riboflavin kinase/FMN adenylyltransferase